MKKLLALVVVLCGPIVLSLGAAGCDGGGKPAKDPAKRIVGSWEGEEGNAKISIVFTSDGEYRLIDREGRVDKKGRYRLLTETELEITENRETPVVMTIEFRSDDEFVMKGGNKKSIVMKRKK
jgi:uncharacterized protein (TIGR03066 family)